jgi:hypothetical protein
VNVKEFIDGLLAAYPSVFRPEESAIKDLNRVLRGLKFSGKQMEQVYDEVLKSSQYFPRAYDIVEAASKFSFSVSGQKPTYEVAWRTWQDDEGRWYAQRRGKVQPESAECYKERVERERCSTEEGVAEFKKAFREAGGKQGTAFGYSYSNVGSAEGERVSDYDDSEAALGVELVIEGGDDWESL